MYQTTGKSDIAFFFITMKNSCGVSLIFLFLAIIIFIILIIINKRVNFISLFYYFLKYFTTVVIFYIIIKFYMTTAEEKLVNTYLAQQKEYNANSVEIRNALKSGVISVDSLKEAFVNKIIEIEVPSDLGVTISNKLKGLILYGKGSHLTNPEILQLFPENIEKEKLNLLKNQFKSTVIYITHKLI